MFVGTAVFALVLCSCGFILNSFLLYRVYRVPAIRKTLHDFCINSLIFWSFLSCLVLGINELGILISGGVSKDFIRCQISGSFTSLGFGNQLAVHAILALDRYLIIVRNNDSIAKNSRLFQFLVLVEFGIIVTIVGTLLSVKKYIPMESNIWCFFQLSEFQDSIELSVAIIMIFYSVLVTLVIIVGYASIFKHTKQTLKSRIQKSGEMILGSETSQAQTLQDKVLKTCLVISGSFLILYGPSFLLLLARLFQWSTLTTQLSDSIFINLSLFDVIATPCIIATLKPQYRISCK